MTKPLTKQEAEEFLNTLVDLDPFKRRVWAGMLTGNGLHGYRSRDDLKLAMVVSHENALKHNERVRKEAEELEEAKKNFVPTKQGILNFLKTYKGLGLTSEKGPTNGFCNCCGTMNARYPNMDFYHRMRWEILKEGMKPYGTHRKERLEVPDAQGTLLISWENE